MLCENLSKGVNEAGQELTSGVVATFSIA